MNTEEHDDLWELLGKARQPAPSPFFSRNVLREVRGLQQERRSFWAGFFFRWQPLTATVCVAALITGSWIASNRRQAEERQQLLVMAEKVYTSPDYGVIKDLDELLDSEKNSAWLSADVN
ncbi:MAG TPA: hypothetical protein VGO11_06555 [Chthoniobacteraceae bacterium]|jgi:hypothetical protein|nr:hypothetical protein [Chthoniobacteraceae bacterium]